MDDYFNKNIFFNNISYLLHEQRMKIGDFENEIGVSHGYISRIIKDQKAKPGIDFIIRAAELLETNIDTLLKTDLSCITYTEQYDINFLNKLVRETLNDKLYWVCESKNYLNRRINTDETGMADHPLFSVKNFYKKTGNYPDKPIFLSKSFGIDTCVAGDCFKLEIASNATLYVMDIANRRCNESDLHEHIREIWFCITSGTIQYLCCNRDSSKEISSLVDELYIAITKSSKHPRVKKEIKDVIDAFMDDFDEGNSNN